MSPWIPVTVFTCPQCHVEFMLYTDAADAEHFGIRRTNYDMAPAEPIECDNFCPYCSADFVDLLPDIMYSAAEDDQYPIGDNSEE